MRLVDLLRDALHIVPNVVGDLSVPTAFGRTLHLAEFAFANAGVPVLRHDSDHRHAELIEDFADILHILLEEPRRRETLRASLKLLRVTSAALQLVVLRMSSLHFRPTMHIGRAMPESFQADDIRREIQT